MNTSILQPTLPTYQNRPPHPSTFFPEFKHCKTKKHILQIHTKLIKTGRIQDPLASAELLRFYALSDPPHRDLRHARQLFDEMPQPNCFSWNTIIRAYCDTNDALESWVLFRKMVEFEIPNKFTFPSVLKACAKMGRVDEGKQVHCVVVKYGIVNDGFVLSNLVRMYVMCGAMDEACVVFGLGVLSSGLSEVVLWNVMVDGYLRVGDVEKARNLFNQMPRKSVVSWNSMISGYAQNGFFVEALELFREMQMEGAADVMPNYVTLVSVLPAVSRLGALEIGKWVHFYAVKNGIKIDPVLGSALIDMYCKCGSFEEGLRLFNALAQKNVITWNSIITGLAIHGRAMDALDHFTKMQQSRITPNDVTYISVLTACSHAGLVDKGLSIFSQMVHTDGLIPRIEHYGCMVDLLGRAGRLQEAEELILKMPGGPDDVVLKALLGACKKHGNIEIGERIGKRLLEIAPEDGAPYVALSNMYASMENWDRVTETRLKMKQNDIKKDPGCSWIEVNGVIHEFIVADRSHSKAQDIYMMLEEMMQKLSLAGYKPDTTQVLLRMDDAEKKSILRYHSEKIAVAFGLISTSRATTVKVVNNLRICDDCHSTFKLVSTIYGRRIVVRDRKRFHHFENGSCSCMDYW
uniref:pentatricopeptide repeat-containing protein At5g48910 n=1 Tax=Erigeron canadensis TaxID=72917 RepID=UPI001CB94466|nr:pentatricopeptide repeat-containing protein At5g48910 [Erigeron canadensis]